MKVKILQKCSGFFIAMKYPRLYNVTWHNFVKIGRIWRIFSRLCHWIGFPGKPIIYIDGTGMAGAKTDF